MKREQRMVEEFRQSHGMESTPAFSIIDLFAEVGEIASDAAKSSDYGMREEKLEVSKDEIGDAMFSLLSVANDLGVDAEEALEESLEKYAERIEEKGDAGSK